MASKCCKLALLLLSLKCLLIAVRARGERGPRSEGRERVIYAEEWAVEIVGGETVAQQIAEKYSLFNRGKVRCLNAMDAPARFRRFENRRSSCRLETFKICITSAAAAQESCSPEISVKSSLISTHSFQQKRM